MPAILDANIVNGNVVTPIDPVDAETYLIVGQSGSVEQINPESAAPIPNPFNPTEIWDRLGGIVVAISTGGLEATVTATQAQSPTASDTIDLNTPVASMIYTFEQSDGSQLVIRATFTSNAPTLQQVLDGDYRLRSSSDLKPSE